MKTLNEMFYDVILLNELSGNKAAAMKFSDPDGPSGRSGGSFGVCQHDTRHGKYGTTILRECGFTTSEIEQVVNMSGDMKALAKKLKPEIVEKYDTIQLSECLNSALNATTGNGVMAVTTGPILALADYVNQYGSIGPAFIEYLNEKDIDGLTIEEVQEWKLKHTKYGREHPKDCERRYKNILKVLEVV
jgi:hypothetical protein